MKKKINVITLGCSKNLVDSERLMAQCATAGYDVEHDNEDSDARVVVINTCGFIGDAKEESVNTILSYVESKKRGEIDNLFVFGCLSERYKDDLRKEVPEVDEYFGVSDLKQVVEKLGARYQKELLGERVLSTPGHYAYLKISEGCNWGCSYCAIPLIRGRHVSIPVDELVKEATILANKGVRELLVIAQDTTYYGIDIYGERKLAELLRRLSLVEGIEWIRLHYAYPTHFPEDLMQEIADNPKICKYLDIPFQHISDGVLKKMRRGHSSKDTYALIEKLRATIPGIVLRTTLLVGHPGEDEQAFADLVEFVTQVRFERLGIFMYSEEEGTWGAANFEDSIPQKVKQTRADTIMRLQARISNELNTAKIGQRLRVVVDRVEGDYYIARTAYDSPEVDGEVLIKKDSPLQIGQFYTVKVTDSNEFDLYGVLDMGVVF